MTNRTIITWTEEQSQRLKVIAGKRGIRVAELIRRIFDEYLDGVDDNGRKRQ